MLEGTHPDSRDKVQLQVLAQETISHMSQHEGSDFALQLLKEGKILADDRFVGKSGFDGIDILIGCDQYWSLMMRDVRMGPRGLAAIKSRLGWTIHGSFQQETPAESHTQALTATTNPTADDSEWSDIEFDHREFWKLEHLGILETEESEPDFQSRYEPSIARVPDGRYVAQFPWRKGWERLKENRKIAEARLVGLMNRFRKHPEELNVYHEQFQTYIDAGYITEADPTYKGIVFLTPHRPVFRNDATSTKCRPVFDGSSHHKGSPSLNQVLEVGPNLNPELLACHMRFRLWKYSWTADIAKAFLQIKLAEGDSQAVRFLWYKDPNNPESLTEYRWARVPFGLTSSPFILRAVILKHLKLYEDRFPETVRQLREQLYVDDWLGGADSLEEAVQRIKEALIIFRDAKFELTKWTTNSKELEALLPELEFQKVPVVIGSSSMSSDTTKALGVYWIQETDHFVFQPKALVAQATKLGRKPTKRQVFSLALMLFDPLGLLSPVVLVAKIIMQKIWATGIKWDDVVPSDITNEWHIFLDGLKDLEQVRVERWVGTTSKTPVELHVFCDASEDAYSAVTYVRQQGDPTTAKILCSKTRVAPPPKKSMSIPRLELLSNLLASKIATYAIKAFSGRSTSANAWTDSTVALCWIQGDSGRWKTFVHNRVEKIREVFTSDNIRHCPGTQNPADLASRGTSTYHLLRAKQWWYGPEWLVKTPQYWPPKKGIQDKSQEELALKEAKEKEIVMMNVAPEEVNLFHERFGNYKRLVCSTAWIKRFAAHTRKRLSRYTLSNVSTQKITKGLKKPKKVPHLTQMEIRQAKFECIRIAQRAAWPNEFADLQARKKLPKQSTIDLLRPVWDPVNRVIRGAGRAEKGYKNRLLPIILPPYHHITTLIIRQAHKDKMHAGTTFINRFLRKTYWIVKAHQRIKFEIGRCVKCQAVNSTNFNAPVAVLPEERITRRKAFDVCGVDFAGPFTIYEKELTDVKKPPPTQKAYACIFTCTATRAVQIEPVPDQSTTSFLFAMRRFVSMRGIPSKMYSDNSKTFIRASKLLGEIKRDKRVVDYLADNDILWKFSPSLAPWWGGFWERMVKTMKKHIRTTVGVKYLDYQQFDVILKETAFLMNNRPITRFNHTDGKTLTPFQLITAEHGYDSEFNKKDFESAESHAQDSSPIKLREREMKRQLRMADWWKEWTEDYVAELRKFHYGETRHIKCPGVGHVVLIHQDVLPRMRWSTGRVKELVKSSDGIIRQVVLVNSKQETLTRPIKCIYPLEAHAGIIDLEPTNTGTLPKTPWRRRFDALERVKAKAQAETALMEEDEQDEQDD